MWGSIVIDGLIARYKWSLVPSGTGSKAQAMIVVAFYYIRRIAQPMSCIAILRSLGLLVLSSMLAACSSSVAENTNPLKWTEEVTLPDGRVISLSRGQHFTSSDLVGKYWFEFRHPESNKVVRWDNEGFWSTVALSLEGPDVILLVRAAFDFNAIGCPQPREVAYRFRDGVWAQVPLLSVANRRLKTNLVEDPKYARERIRRNRGRLDAKETIEATKIHGAEKIIDFSDVREQVFLCKHLQRIDIK